MHNLLNVDVFSLKESLQSQYCTVSSLTFNTWPYSVAYFFPGGSGLSLQLTGASSTPTEWESSFPKQTWIIQPSPSLSLSLSFSHSLSPSLSLPCLMRSLLSKEGNFHIESQPGSGDLDLTPPSKPLHGKWKCIHVCWIECITQTWAVFRLPENVARLQCVIVDKPTGCMLWKKI